MVFTHSTTRCIMAITIIIDIKGYIHSGFFPVRSLSIKIRDVAESIIPNKYARAVVIITKTTAAPAPVSLFLAKSKVLFGFPSGTKFSDGIGTIHTPVKELSNSSQLTATFPRAGSFRYTLFPRKPSSTTK